MSSVLINDLINGARVRNRWDADADVARALGCEPVRLYQWKTHRRRMPASTLINLAILAGADTTSACGQYTQEWELVRNHPELVGGR